MTSHHLNANHNRKYRMNSGIKKNVKKIQKYNQINMRRELN